MFQLFSDVDLSCTYYFAVLKLKVVKNVQSNNGGSYSDGGSSIKVTNTGNVVQSISFQSYATIGCILSEKENW